MALLALHNAHTVHIGYAHQTRPAGRGRPKPSRAQQTTGSGGFPDCEWLSSVVDRRLICGTVGTHCVWGGAGEGGNDIVVKRAGPRGVLPTGAR